MRRLGQPAEVDTGRRALGQHRQADAVLQRRPGARGVRQRAVLGRAPARGRRGPWRRPAQPGNALDSGWLFDTRLDYSTGAHRPIRFLAQGRDVSATIDSALSGTPGFQNDGDNEITGIHVSDGDATEHGLLGAKRPRPFRDGWRVFYNQQHGDNIAWEILRVRGQGDRDDD